MPQFPSKKGWGLNGFPPINITNEPHGEAGEWRVVRWPSLRVARLSNRSGPRPEEGEARPDRKTRTGLFGRRRRRRQRGLGPGCFPRAVTFLMPGGGWVWPGGSKSRFWVPRKPWRFLGLVRTFHGLRDQWIPTLPGWVHCSLWLFDPRALGPRLHASDLRGCRIATEPRDPSASPSSSHFFLLLRSLLLHPHTIIGVWPSADQRPQHLTFVPCTARQLCLPPSFSWSLCKSADDNLYWKWQSKSGESKTTTNVPLCVFGKSPPFPPSFFPPSA